MITAMRTTSNTISILIPLIKLFRGRINLRSNKGRVTRGVGRENGEGVIELIRHLADGNANENVS